jgi:hypothetical protein
VEEFIYFTTNSIDVILENFKITMCDGWWRGRSRGWSYWRGRWGWASSRAWKRVGRSSGGRSAAWAIPGVEFAPLFRCFKTGAFNMEPFFATRTFN